MDTTVDKNASIRSIKALSDGALYHNMAGKSQLFWLTKAQLHHVYVIDAVTSLDCS